MAVDLLPVPIDWTTGTIITVISIIYVYLTWSYDYWKERNVPFEKPKFLFGNFKDVFYVKKTVGDLMMELYWKMDENPYVGAYRFLNPAVLIRDPDLIRAILVKDFDKFQDNSQLINEKLEPLLARNPSYNSGEKWKKIRSLLSPTFMSGKLRPLLPLMQEVACDMLQYIQDVTASSSPDGIEVKELASRFTTDAIASCAFGISGQSFKEPVADMWAMGRNILKADLDEGIRYQIAYIFPSLRKILRIRQMKPEAELYSRQVIKKVTEVRKDMTHVRQDLLYHLLQLKTRVEDDGSEYSDEDVTAHALMFLVEGLETSSAALSFLLYELAMNSNVQNKLLKELRGALEKDDGMLNYDTIMGLPYLNMIFLETLRKHPPVLVLEKICTQPYELPAPPGGTDVVPIDPGTLVLIPVKALHHDPKYFPQPDVFDPERFSERRRDSIHRFAYLPFGEGPRLCLGMRFAELNIKTAAVSIVLHYDVRKTAKTPDPIVQDPNCSFACAKGGLWLEFEKRL